VVSTPSLAADQDGTVKPEIAKAGIGIAPADFEFWRIADPALGRLAVIVRGADASRYDLAPQCGGLCAISLGLSANFPDDHEMLEHGTAIFDALYTWCRSLQSEAHKWPSAAETMKEARRG
jgi:hypothetical protein